MLSAPISFKWFFDICCKIELRFIGLYVQLFQYHLLKRLFFLHWITFCILVENKLAIYLQVYFAKLPDSDFWTIFSFHLSVDLSFQ